MDLHWIVGVSLLKPAFALLLPDDETSQLFAPPQLLWRSSCVDWRCSDVLLHNDALGLYCSAVPSLCLRVTDESERRSYA